MSVHCRNRAGCGIGQFVSGSEHVTMNDGHLNCEFNLFEIQRTKLTSKDKLPVGDVKIEVESKLASKIGGPVDVTRLLDSKRCRRRCFV